MTFVIPFPSIDPILVEIGPLAIRWYGLAYVVGLILGWQYVRRLAKGPPPVTYERNVDDFLVWATLGVVLGGRIGYVLFYQPAYFFAHPLAIFEVWAGGMSFHGGLLGVVTASLIFVHRRNLPLLAFGDTLACAAPIGLFFGRLANFINGELFGRPTDVPWAMVFPRGGPLPRHPSQIYEALMEGVLLFTVLYLLWRREAIRRRSGTLIGVFLIGYAIARSVGELFRQPDVQIGFLLGGTTMGQWLSAPMLIAGLYLILRAKPRA
jgi:phosphatidylglycerol:prolipoprotein diacylglycerol transferase